MKATNQPENLSDRPGEASGIRRRFYSVKEAETILNVSHATIYRDIAAGRLDARKYGNKTQITGESIERRAAELPKVPSLGCVEAP